MTADELEIGIVPKPKHSCDTYSDADQKHALSTLFFLFLGITASKELALLTTADVNKIRSPQAQVRLHRYPKIASSSPI